MEAIFILSAYNFCLGVLSSIAVGVSPIQAGRNAAEIQKAGIDSYCTARTAASIGSSSITEVIEKVHEEEQYNFDESVSEDKETSDESIYNEDAVCFWEGFDSSFKAYMDYRCITDTGSLQYEIQQQAYSDERGFRRVGDDYCVALGTGITDGCGERFLITLDSGYSFTAIVSDVKADVHTDSTNCYAPRGDNGGNVVEFVIDSDLADPYMLNCGSAGCFDDLSGNITSISRIE